MRTPRSRWSLVFSLVILALTASYVYPRCGVERWDTKVGRGAEAASVDLSAPTSTTIADLTDPTRYPLLTHWPPPNRIVPVETTLWVVDATLLRNKFEDDPHAGDSDYHLVISDSAGHTMIAEIPFPDCAPVNRPGQQCAGDPR